VRLYPVEVDTTLWQGDRLAVLPGYRTAQLGGPLVQFAVNSARERGGTRMIAHVQLPNVRFFQRLGWRTVGDLESYVGIPHQQMLIDF
jgi:predicted GNAT family N-acyltransferase